MSIIVSLNINYLLHPRGFCLDKELGIAVYAEVVIRTKRGFRGNLLEVVVFVLVELRDKGAQVFPE